MNLLVLQLSDSAFPVGGFAHSSGLEAAAQLGELAGEGTLAAMLDGLVWQAALAGTPFTGAGHAARDAEELVAVDRCCEVFLVQPVANRASRVQGRALASTAASVWPDRAPIADLHAAVRGGRLLGHHAVVFGAVLAALDLGEDEARRLFVFLALRGALSAAVRLGVLGPLEAQRLLFERRALVDEAAAAARHLKMEQAAQPAPLLEVVGGLHDRLYARLFQS